MAEGGALPNDSGGQSSGAGGQPNALAGFSGDGGVSVEVEGGNAGAAGDSGQPAHWFPCPQLGKSITYSAGEDYPADPILDSSIAFGCDLSGPDPDNAGLMLRLYRFEVKTPTLYTAWASHVFNTFPELEKYTLMGDCGDADVVTPESANVPESYVQPPTNLVKLLEPGIYTQVVCTTGLFDSELETPPSAPINVDCAHAKPLREIFQANPIVESRILEPARFYEFTSPQDATDYYVELGSGQGWSPVTLTLHSLSSNYTYTTSGKLWEHFTLNLESTTPTDYCLEVQAGYGAQYSFFEFYSESLP